MSRMTSAAAPTEKRIRRDGNLNDLNDLNEWSSPLHVNSCTQLLHPCVGASTQPSGTGACREVPVHGT